MKKIIVSGVIGWDATAQQLRDDLRGAAGDDVEIVISSPGGYVSDALEMYNLIRNYDGKTTAILSGYAMSAASYIPMAADVVLAEDNAAYMIHNAQGMAWGDHNEMGKTGAILQGMSKMIGQAYGKFTGKSEADVATLMDAETYYFGQGIVDAGFAHEVIDVESDGADEDVVKAMAQSAFDNMAVQMSGKKKEFTADLARAVTMSGIKIENQHVRAQVAPANQSTEDDVMDLLTLKEKHPDLVAAIAAEATAQVEKEKQAEIEAARMSGAESERNRIAEVRAQSIPGHEAIIETMELDGKSTAADAAMAIVAAEKKARTVFAQNMDEEANGVVPAAEETHNGKTMKRKDYDLLQPAEKGSFVASGGIITD